MDLPDLIEIDPDISFGKPRVKGTRVWVGVVLGLLADGLSSADIVAEYPQLTEADVRACLDYAARVAAGHFVDVACG